MLARTSIVDENCVWLRCVLAISKGVLINNNQYSNAGPVVLQMFIITPEYFTSFQ